MNKRMGGFTLIELLIVIVVIAILITISFVSYNGIQTRAQNTKITADLTMLEKALLVAREQKAQPLSEFIPSCGGGGESACCFNNGYTSLASATEAPDCWQSWQNAIQLLSTATGISLSGMLDPWKQPYIIETHERQGDCTSDTIYAAKPPISSWQTTRVGTITLPKSSYC